MNALLKQSLINLKAQGCFGYSSITELCLYQTNDNKHCIAGLMIKHLDPNLDIEMLSGGIDKVMMIPRSKTGDAVFKLLKNEDRSMLRVTQVFHDIAAEASSYDYRSRRDGFVDQRTWDTNTTTIPAIWASSLIECKERFRTQPESLVWLAEIETILKEMFP